MSYQNYNLTKIPFTSSASRNIYHFRNHSLLFFKTPHLTLYKKWKAGRNDSGRIVMRSKSSLLTRSKMVQINYNYTSLYPSFISNFHFIPRKNKLISLVRFLNGGFSYYTTTENHFIFSVFYLKYIKHFTEIGKCVLFNVLIRTPNLTKISLIEFLPGRGAQYCRSSGVLCKILKYDYKRNATLIKLPSGKSKLFSSLSKVSLERVVFQQNRNFLNSKAGYWRRFGFKPIVRGVAMNPVDHPHGGRTKSIRYQRTPWGKTTKYK